MHHTRMLYTCASRLSPRLLPRDSMTRLRSPLPFALICLSLLGPPSHAASTATKAGLHQQNELAPPRAKGGARKHVKHTAAHLPGRHGEDAEFINFTQWRAVNEFIDEMSEQHGFDKGVLLEQFRRVQYRDQVVKLINPPPASKAKNWQAYRERFIEPRRIEAGAAFWQRHQDALARAEQQYGVPAEVVVGIIGVETFYGQHMGQHRLLDALALTTLSLDFPAEHPRASERRDFFRAELGHFLVQLKRYPKRTWRGSYAGAMGWPQFMPSSWARFAVDFDGDGQIDLMNSPVDAIGSVANYFKAFGWKTGLPTHHAIQLQASEQDMDILLAPDILPSFSLETLQAKGVQLPESAQQHPGPYALVELQNGDAPNSYVAGTDNFYVVTRYNWSSYYAMAVIGLGQAVKGEMHNRR